MKIINKKNIYLLALLVICLIGIVIVPTYAKFTSGFTTEEDAVALSLTFNLGISKIEEYEELTIPAGGSEKFNVEITNSTGSTVYYGIWYKMVNPSTLSTDMQIGKLQGSTVSTSGSIDTDASTTVTVAIVNSSSTDMKINIGVASSTTGTSDIEYLNNRYLITGETTITGIANHPNLDNGNLIPVYYDEKDEQWKKADSNNEGNSWYDYDNKEWANAILISDSTKRSTYKSADVDTEIPISDISAFYVWIPRYKYRVWNITREVGEESTYAYEAYSKGIEIKFESGTGSTGNVVCSYDVTTEASEINLSDECVYDKTDIITKSSENINYPDAWYTHPAFDFGGISKTGIWVGKFETSGSTSIPTILPDAQALTGQNISTHFTTAKVFQTYGLSNEIDAHMLTNLEWGAIAYLTHSIYGLCDGTACHDAYINNSSDGYTGRSGGAIAGSDSLQLTNFYGSDITTSTEMYNEAGYYTYKGYKIDSSGNVTSTKNTSKIASTTGNITGVYDMSGGTWEYVMANMVDSSFEFYPHASGNNWNGSSTLDSKYYNKYSYLYDVEGSFNTQYESYNRARLGDATVENVSMTFTENGAWQPGNVISAAQTAFFYYSDFLGIEFHAPWLMRGGSGRFDDIISGIFAFYVSDGNSGTYASAYITSRSSLS